MCIKELKEKLIPLLREFDVVKAGIFGSYATGGYDENSDIDVVVQFVEGKSLLDLVGLKYALEEATNKKADVLTYNSIYPKLRDIILKEEVILYE